MSSLPPFTFVSLPLSPLPTFVLPFPAVAAQSRVSGTEANPSDVEAVRDPHAKQHSPRGHAARRSSVTGLLFLPLSEFFHARLLLLHRFPLPKLKMENDDKYLPELLAEKDSLDVSFTHAMKLLNAGKAAFNVGVRAETVRAAASQLRTGPKEKCPASVN